jgi:cathepsin A (carboxypeptidase C)
MPAKDRRLLGASPDLSLLIVTLMPVAFDSQADHSKCAECKTFCHDLYFAPMHSAKLNLFDVRLKTCVGKSGICYDFDKETEWARSPATAGALGLSPKDKTPWSACNWEVQKDFASDWMRGYSNRIPALLHEGTRVLIYAGDADYICNCT